MKNSRFLWLLPVVFLPLLLMADNFRDDIGRTAKEIYEDQTGCDITGYTEKILDTTRFIPIDPPYTNGDSVEIQWLHIDDTSRYNRCEYYIDYATDTSFFDSVFDSMRCQSTGYANYFYNLPVIDTIVLDNGDLESAVWYIRLTALADSNIINGSDTTSVFMKSEVSDMMRITYEIKPPELNYFQIADLVSGDPDTTVNNTVRVIINAQDNYYLKDLELSEYSDFFNSTRIPLNTSDTLINYDSLSYSMSLQKREKIIYARVIDGAGNVSVPAQDTINLFDSGRYAHCYPNPFNPGKGQHTNLVFHMDNGGDEVTIRIFDLFGNLVYTRTDEGQAGSNDGGRDEKWRWYGTDDQGNEVASGGYIGIISIPGEEDQKIKIAVIK
jgi:hypothetical protein